MRHKPILVWVLAVAFIAGCAGDSLIDPLAQSAVSSAGNTAATNQSVVVAGAGLLLQPARINLTVPVATSADILEASFYWMGRGPTAAGDDTIVIDGVSHTGTLVSSQDAGGSDPWILIYKLDATGIVVPGAHEYVVEGFDPGGLRRGGVALAVIHNDPTSQFSRIRTVEPYELVRWDMAGQDRGGVWSFPITPDASDRIASLTLVTADCEAFLPDNVWWGAGAGTSPSGDLVGAGNRIADQLTSSLGPWLDILRRPALLVPAGSGHFAYQVESPSGGDSIVHLFGAVGITGDVAPSCSGTIGDRVWNDLDGDGIQDPGEPALAGVTVSLADAAGSPVASTTTDVLGWFAFDGLCAGTYEVTVTAPANFDPSPCDQGGDDNLDSDCSPAMVTLQRDTEVISNVDFGFKEDVPPPPPTPTPGCFWGVGFWKHEVDVAADANPGRGHFSPGQMAGMLQGVQALESLGIAGDDGVLTYQECGAILRNRPKTPCGRSTRQALAAMFNFAANGMNPDVLVDTDRDDVPDTGFGTAMDQLQALLAAGDPASCKAAGDLAESINQTPSDNCSF
ncbi:MAG TPA: SdrD B-like domain-containing protein [bacterium]|nr:SdrD B-like domain-containing protein [bacterium]